MDIYNIQEGDEVIITTGQLDGNYGHVVLITRYQSKPDKAMVSTLDENNNQACRAYNLSNLMKEPDKPFATAL